LVVANLQQFVESLREGGLCSLTVAFDGHNNPTVAYSVPDCPPDDLSKKIDKLGEFILKVLEQAHDHRADYELEEEDRHPKWDITYA
jgi:hypothetical protein